MRIAQVAPLQVVVPPRAYGGTERVIANLTEALVRLGHDVTLFATGDSQTSAGLVSMREAALNFNPAVEATAIHIAELTEVYRRASEFDVIHSHLDYLTLPFAAASATPVSGCVVGAARKRSSSAASRAFASFRWRSFT